MKEQEQTFFKIVSSEVSVHRDFQLVAGKLLKIDVVQKGPEMFCADSIDAAVVAKALKAGKISKPFTSINVTEATEDDLKAAKAIRPELAPNVEGWIKFLKDGATPPPPLRIEIVNASELQKDTVVTLRRDESGKLTAATAVKV
jgi:hypothetical protein